MLLENKQNIKENISWYYFPGFGFDTKFSLKYFLQSTCKLSCQSTREKY